MYWSKMQITLEVLLYSPKMIIIFREKSLVFLQLDQEFPERKNWKTEIAILK